MSRIPELLSGMNAFIDGDTFIGKVVKFAPDEPNPITKETSNPGHAGKFKRATGKWSESMPKLTLASYEDAVLGMVGNDDSVDKVVRVVGAVKTRTGYKNVVYEYSGLWEEIEHPEWADEADIEISFGVSARKWKLTIDGEEIKYIDYELTIVRLLGADKSSELRSIIGA